MSSTNFGTGFAATASTIASTTLPLVTTGAGYNDMYIDSTTGILVTVDNIDAITQTVTANIKLWKAEYGYDITQGVSYRDILGNPQLKNSFVIYQLRKAILSANNYLTSTQLSTYGIEQITELSYTQNPETGLGSVSTVILLYNGTTRTITT